MMYYCSFFSSPSLPWFSFSGDDNNKVLTQFHSVFLLLVLELFFSEEDLKQIYLSFSLVIERIKSCVVGWDVDTSPCAFGPSLVEIFSSPL